MIRVLIADDSGLVCDAMRTILDRDEGIYVVGCARTLEETEFLLPHANLLLVGPALEGENILELVRHVHEMARRIDVVLGEGGKGRVSHEAALRSVRERLRALEERLR